MEIRKEFRLKHPEFSAILESDRYAFLRDNEHLGDNVILLGLSGSRAYGTNKPNSDYDVRGVALNTKRELLGMTTFDQFLNEETDTTIYSVNRFVRLLADCNPNIIELLGLADDDYIYISPLGQMLLDNKDLFLTKRAYHTFGGYAYAQLKRLQNATARDSLEDEEREKHILHSVEKQIEQIQENFADQNGDITLEIDDAITEGHSKEIYMNGKFEHYPLRGFNQMYNAMNQVCKDYDHLDHRNRKKDDAHLNKHAMHLIRLYQMAVEILGKGELSTRRTGDDLELLRSIRHGDYMVDSVMSSAFYQLVDKYEGLLESAYEKSTLPKSPDFKRIEELLIAINEKSIIEK